MVDGMLVVLRGFCTEPGKRRISIHFGLAGISHEPVAAIAIKSTEAGFNQMVPLIDSPPELVQSVAVTTVARRNVAVLDGIWRGICGIRHAWRGWDGRLRAAIPIASHPSLPRF
jgi:hypothetical protein